MPLISWSTLILVREVNFIYIMSSAFNQLKINTFANYYLLRVIELEVDN